MSAPTAIGNTPTWNTLEYTLEYTSAREISPARRRATAIAPRIFHLEKQH
jgi:hypothetical protein